ncbi:hypothetical protein DMN91_001622 [Ooceraea biroi]|uniref:ISXO2-like transposase domain-containing protein n=1 Tax=Ooceraea biroi TaxID=2015173 RepID=A0A3L8DYP4_OOCBI|nr:hypothetical protein DMN91_001622 [Ooceraea biroi]
MCNFKISALTNTWFERAALDITKICRLISYFLLLNSPRQLFLQEELSITSRTAVDWINFCRELLAQWLLHNEEQIGGPNVVVEIDEAKFGRRKYHRGRLITGQWLFGGVERHTGRFFVVPVKQRSSQILIPIVRRFIAPGTIILRDCWKAYNNLKNYNYIHCVVNHSENFVDPHTGAHTQNIERLWRDIRHGVPRYGTRDYHYVHYLAEFIFKPLITMTCCCLHNMLCSQSTGRAMYAPSGFLDEDNNIFTGQIRYGEWREEPANGLVRLCHQGGNRHATNACVLRDTWTEYFNGPGAVPWQERLILGTNVY